MSQLYGDCRSRSLFHHVTQRPTLHFGCLVLNQEFQEKAFAMRFQLSMLLLGMVLVGLGCEPIETLDRPKPVSTTRETQTTIDWKDAKQVQQDVRQIMTATFEGDVDTIVSFTHDHVLGIVDDPELIREAMEGVMAKLHKSGVKLEEFDFTEEPHFLESAQSHFVVVPTRTIMTIDGNRVGAIGYQFGEKKKSETKWKYIEGRRVNEQTVQEMFPEFPSDYQFPESEMGLE